MLCRLAATSGTRLRSLSASRAPLAVSSTRARALEAVQPGASDLPWTDARAALDGTEPTPLAPSALLPSLSSSSHSNLFLLLVTLE